MTDKNDQEKFDAQLLAQMVEDFLEESQELLDQLNLNLTRLEDNPEDEELINEIFRNAHTIKGTASFIGLDKIKEVAHKMEDVFGAIRKKALKVNASLIDVMFEALEVLTLLKDKSRTKDPADVDISWVINNLLGILGGTLPESEERIPENKTIAEKPGQIPIPKSKIQNQAAEAAAVRKTASISETIRVPTERLDNFMNLVGEMITSQNRLSNFSDKFKNAELSIIASAIARLTSQIHTGLMSVRMVPIEKLFNKFPGVVRNLARERNKELELIINGKDTELDKTVIEQIYDPLVHLLRNAIDHGIESSEKRQEQGKSPVGQISLSAWHSQNNVIIEVADDGQGIDPARMKQVAIQKGIITEEKALAMTDDQAIRLIFLPGFSSAEKVTDISGRGVGMDVVKENVQKLRGMVDVRTKVGKGTTFHIQMPLTLAILSGPFGQGKWPDLCPAPQYG